MKFLLSQYCTTESAMKIMRILQGNVEQLVGRIDSQILGVKGLIKLWPALNFSSVSNTTESFIKITRIKEMITSL